MANKPSLSIYSLFLVLCLFLASPTFQQQPIHWYPCPFFTNYKTSLLNSTDSLLHVQEIESTLLEIARQQENEKLVHISQQIFGDGPTIPFEIPRLTKRNIHTILKAMPAIPSYAPQAECAYVPVPLDYEDPSGPKIKVFTKRITPEAQPKSTKRATKALWLLQGGPGGSSDSLEPILLFLYQYFQGDFQVYYLEHRGVGRSTRLGCTAPQAETFGSDGGVSITETEIPNCASAFVEEYGTNNTQFFSTTGAALDLQNIIQQTKSDKDVFVYGISYGTFWASRFLQLPNSDGLVKAVVLDGMVSQVDPVRTSLDQWDRYMNMVGLDFVNICLNNTDCLNKVKSIVKAPYSVSNFVESVFTKLYTNSTFCSDLTGKYSKNTLKMLLGKFITDEDLRRTIPSILYRLFRCDVDLDYGVLYHLYDSLSSAVTAQNNTKNAPLSSEMLSRNIMYSEIWSIPPPSVEDIKSIYDNAYFAMGMYDYAASRASWPVYQAPKYLNRAFSVEKTKILILNGDLDAQTPFIYAQTEFDAIQVGPSSAKYLVKIPYAPHFTLFRSPTIDSPIDCGMQVFLSFVQNTEQAPNVTCVKSVKPLDFFGASPATTSLLGTPDLFDGFFEPEEQQKTINLYVFIGVEVATIVLGLIVICSLIYIIVYRNDKRAAELANYENGPIKATRNDYQDLDAANQQ